MSEGVSTSRRSDCTSRFWCYLSSLPANRSLVPLYHAHPHRDDRAQSFSVSFHDRKPLGIPLTFSSAPKLIPVVHPALTPSSHSATTTSFRVCALLHLLATGWREGNILHGVKYTQIDTIFGCPTRFSTIIFVEQERAEPSGEPFIRV